MRRQILLYLAPWLAAAVLWGLWYWLAESAVPRLIEQAYHQQSLPSLNRIIKDRTRPVEFYLEEWHERRQGLFGAGWAVMGAWAAGGVNLAQWLRSRRRRLGRLDARQMDRTILLLVLGAAAGVFFLLIYPLLAGHVYLYDDLGYLHLPLRSYYSRSLQEGRLPSWCPELFCGFDAHGEGQGGFFHPVKLLLYWLLPLEAAFNVDTVLAYPLAFGGMWFFLRRRGLGHGPSALGGMTYAFSAYVALRLNHTNVIQILAHLPWLLGCLDILLRSARAPQRRLAGAAIAAWTASQLLLGYPPSVWYSGLAELAYVLVIGWGRALPGKLLQFGAAKLLGLLLAAVQVLPTLAQIPLSQRAQLGLKGLAMDSLSAWNFFQWISPYAFTERAVGPARPWEFAQYAGLLAPSALGWLLVEMGRAMDRRRQRSACQTGSAVRLRDRRLMVWAVLMVLLGAVFALGAYGPVFWLLAHWPPFSFFRSWARYSLWIFVGLSVGAAVAVQGLLRRADRASQTDPPSGAVAGLARPTHWLLATLVLLSALPLGLARLDGLFLGGLPWASMAGLLFGPVAMAVVWWLLHRSAQGKASALVALVAFHLADLAWYDLSYWLTRCRFDRLDNFIASIDLPPQPEQEAEGPPSTAPGPQRLETRPGTLQALAPAETFSSRVWTEPAQEANVFLLVGLRSAGGWWGGLVPRQTLPYPDVKALRVAGVAWWKKSPFDQTPWQPVPQPLPEIRLVPHAVVSQEPAKDLQRIDPAKTVLVDRPIENQDETSSSGVIPKGALLPCHSRESGNPEASSLFSWGEGGLRGRPGEGGLRLVLPAQAGIQKHPLSPPRERLDGAAGRVWVPQVPAGAEMTTRCTQTSLECRLRRNDNSLRGRPASWYAPSPGQPTGWPSLPTEGRGEGEAYILERRPGFFRIQTQTATRQFLVVAETWHPGWQAQMDGRPAEILRAYGDFMTVPVGAGEHEVILHWAPASLRWGLIVAGVGLAGLALWIATGLVSKRPFPLWGRGWPGASRGG